MKTHRSEIKRFEKIYREEFERLEGLEEDCYLVNGTLDEFRRVEKEKLVVYLPYCLKPVECLHRLKYSCDSDCSECVIGPIIRFLDKHGIKHHFIIYDDIDVPKGIKYQIERHEKIYAVICILCPEAALENRHFIKAYKVPVLMFFIRGFEDCDFRKATKGKFWGETEFDYKTFERVMKEILEQS